ncbi:DUF2268 domain-containing putative Zn-dependent protease [Roseinatronobacter alkalisoli]|uniref:DUF2268 domain-containing putative Zn-dependent protease n=1 Tax=Roseinatronobacter alkalisoli TaxID=3028235 RepID=A0ABT5TEF5_9RHOB|nr:DUF2268 domain-containing putative Zn-dependent protease [Roseinatronobacter sp. HJB301]MDD7972766.1 DUF2268 domain-containing putative Zn-dependent protease [Roseinatronobacter sp. HJB301]
MTTLSRPPQDRFGPIIARGTHDVVAGVMPKMILHFLDARDQLSGLQGWLAELLNTAFDTSAELLPLRDTDVVIKAGTHVIPEKGHLGCAPEAGLIYVTVDPRHPSLRANVSRSVERMLAHELHHCSRWDGPGYGNTLGEALISEGLAGHFSQEAFGGPPEQWESMTISTLRPHITKVQNEWGSREYGHEAWFFGSSELPRWLGYSLGYHVVAQYLAACQQTSASGLVHADAKIFLPYLGDI